MFHPLPSVKPQANVTVSIQCLSCDGKNTVSFFLAPFYDCNFLPLAKTWLSDENPKDVISILEYKPSKSSPSRLRSNCLLYVRRAMPALFFQDPQLHCTQDAIRLRVNIDREGLPIRTNIPPTRLLSERYSIHKCLNKMHFHPTGCFSIRNTDVVTVVLR